MFYPQQNFSSSAPPAFAPSAGGLGRQLPPPLAHRRRYGMPTRRYQTPDAGLHDGPGFGMPPPLSSFGRVLSRPVISPIQSDPYPGPEFGIFPSLDRNGNLIYW